MTPEETIQQTLAGEHAALYVLGVCAAQTSRSTQVELWTRLDAAWREHRTARDELTARLERLGRQPVAAEPAYALPGAVDTPAAVQALARSLEQRMAGTYAGHVAGTVAADRRWGAEALTRSAIRLLWFRGAPEILPGTNSS
ncbi:hypothetical protein GCM10027425_20950 [Alteromonas gracilis]